jgi:endonuclease/exonuclease/phosphatase family metal-dependent hydrolase
LGLVVRTWNIFHGRTVPEGRTLHVEQMVRLVTEDGPGIVALQEVPVWALACVEEWSGMRALGAVAMRARGGPFARWLTAFDPRRLRSTLVGQANVLLLGAGAELAGAQEVFRLNPRPLRRWLRLRETQRLDWARNRRVCQVAPVRSGGTAFHALNLHASKGADLARVELERLARLIPEGPAVVCGDLNAPETGLPGFTPPLPGIDQILVRGLELERPPARWPAERRRHDGALLSDHAPVEATVHLGSSPA